MRRAIIDIRSDGNDVLRNSREFFKSTEADKFYDVDHTIRAYIIRSSVRKAIENGTSTDEEIKNMLSKYQKQQALKKRVIGAAVVFAIDGILLGVTYYRYRNV